MLSCNKLFVTCATAALIMSSIAEADRQASNTEATNYDHGAKVGIGAGVDINLGGTSVGAGAGVVLGTHSTHQDTHDQMTNPGGNTEQATMNSGGNPSTFDHFHGIGAGAGLGVDVGNLGVDAGAGLLLGTFGTHQDTHDQMTNPGGNTEQATMNSGGNPSTFDHFHGIGAGAGLGVDVGNLGVDAGAGLLLGTFDTHQDTHDQMTSPGRNTEQATMNSGGHPSTSNHVHDFIGAGAGVEIGGVPHHGENVSGNGNGLPNGEPSGEYPTSQTQGGDGNKEPCATSNCPDTPVVYTPVIHTPDAHTPDAHTPAVYTPDAHTPVVHTPAVYTPDAHTPVVNTPEQEPPIVQHGKTGMETHSEYSTLDMPYNRRLRSQI